MTELLSSSTQRARASALKKKLDPFIDGVVDAVIVPIIQVEGSPRQVAARQIQEAFDGVVSPEEAVCVEEAARCVTVLARIGKNEQDGDWRGPSGSPTAGWSDPAPPAAQPGRWADVAIRSA